MNEHYLHCPELLRVMLVNVDPQYKVSDFAAYIGVDQNFSQFRACMKAAGYHGYVSSYGKNNKSQTQFGYTAEKIIANHVANQLGYESYSPGKRVTKDALRGRTDGSIDDKYLLEIKTRSRYSDLTDTELHLLNPEVDTDAFWQAAIYAYITNLPYFVVATYYGSEFDYQTGYPNSLYTRTFIKVYRTSDYREQIMWGINRFNDVKSVMDMGYTPCYDPTDEKDMMLINHLLSN